jgi:hypothetical protein
MSLPQNVQMAITVAPFSSGARRGTVGRDVAVLREFSLEIRAFSAG